MVRFKAALSPRDDHGALCSVTKEFCGHTQPPPSHVEALGNPALSSPPGPSMEDRNE